VVEHPTVGFRPSGRAQSLNDISTCPTQQSKQVFLCMAVASRFVKEFFLSTPKLFTAAEADHIYTYSISAFNFLHVVCSLQAGTLY
jgi:hypothetical protein